MKYDNPFVIYKDSSPYLYLTENSGIIANPYSGSGGMVIALNPNAQPQYNLVSLQLWVRSGMTFHQNLFDIQYGATTLSVEVETTADGRGFITYGGGLKWYQNGALVIQPVLQPAEWSALTISFDPFISLNGISGTLILREGYLFNNISEYVYENDPTTLHFNKFDIAPTSSNNVYEDYTYASQTGTAIIIVDDMSHIEVFSNGVDMFTDVEWQTFEKNVI